MTPKDKAKDLVADFILCTLGCPTITNEQAKFCADQCVEEILEYLKIDGYPPEHDYWKKVQSEIKSL